MFSGLVVRSSSKVLHISMCYRHLLLSKKLPMRHKQNHAFCSFRQVKHIRLRSGGRYEKAEGGGATHTRVIRFVRRVLEYNFALVGSSLPNSPLGSTASAPAYLPILDLIMGKWFICSCTQVSSFKLLFALCFFHKSCPLGTIHL